MRILNLKLRGAIGIWKGLGLEEIEIDFTKFQPGLIALVGGNGSGKTTIMENLQPYRTLVSKLGSLQSHFYLKNSYRVLKFEYNGHIYESTILIDALTGASEAYLRTENDVVLNDGKVSTYDLAIEELLGSQELFFNSVFNGQKSKGIADLKPADRRKLFYELLNLNSYETHLERAKGELKNNELKLAEVEGSIRVIREQFNEMSAEDLQDQLKTLETKELEAVREVKDTEAHINSLSETIKDCEMHLLINGSTKKQNFELTEKIKDIDSQIGSIKNELSHKLLKWEVEIQDNSKLISREQKLLANKEAIVKAISEIKVLNDERTQLQNQLSAIQTANSNLSASYNEEYSKALAIERELLQKRNNKDAKEKELVNIRKEIVRIKNDVLLIDEVPCDELIGHECKFLQNAYSSKEQLENLVNAELSIIVDSVKITEDISLEEKHFSSTMQMLKEKYEISIEKNNKEIIHFNAAIARTNSRLTELNKTEWNKLNDELSNAENNIKLYEQKIQHTKEIINEANSSSQKQIENLELDKRKLFSKIDSEIDNIISDLETKIEDAKLALTRYKNNLEALKIIAAKFPSEIEAVKSSIVTLKQNIERVEKLNAEKLALELEIKDWTFLTKAFDKTGIPVLKLENSGVEITSIANELLSLFENKFRIVFETTSLTKDKKKLKETFDINIVEEDGVCEIGNKSGGQQVWLETAIQLAISLVVRKQGRNIETSFLDEKDGALDLDNAYSYIEMIRKGHQMSGVHNTFLITHRTELLDYIPQQVKLTNGILECVN